MCAVTMLVVGILRALMLMEGLLPRLLHGSAPGRLLLLRPRRSRRDFRRGLCCFAGVRFTCYFCSAVSILAGNVAFFMLLLLCCLAASGMCVQLPLLGTSCMTVWMFVFGPVLCSP